MLIIEDKHDPCKTSFIVENSSISLNQKTLMTMSADAAIKLGVIK